MSLSTILRVTTVYLEEHPESRSDLERIYGSFTEALIKTTPQILPPKHTTSTLNTRLEDINSTLKSLQNVTDKLRRQIAPPPNPLPTDNALDTPPKNLTHNMRAATHASIVIHTHIQDPKARQHPAKICQSVNASLQQTELAHVQFTAARWTSRGNLILTGGTTNTHKQMLSASHIFLPALSPYLPNKLLHDAPPSVVANVKWSKLLVNNVPTGTTTRRGPWTPDDCHKALLTDNPAYASLNITQKPSWVRPPESYKLGSFSSLTFSFEDPDASRVRPWVAQAQHGLRSLKTELDAPPPTPPTPNHDPPLNVPNPISSPEQVANILDEAEQQAARP
ncbi:hypothetical protein EDB85DRAFT_1887630 [Lactarius pseudohatsudake]|nr:hypothetical protein EDB85DRAFT_1887630 [Lactarius pseudohatsudake]